MTRDDRKDRDGLGAREAHADRADREALDALRGELEAATPEPTPDDRAAILAACEPALEENARAAASHETATHSAPTPPRRGFAVRFRAWIAAHPAPAAAVAAVAVVLTVVWLAPPFPTRARRSAPLQTWAEHVSASTTEPGRPLPVAVATFERPY
jgi:hypothetical protein